MEEEHKDQMRSLKVKTMNNDIYHLEIKHNAPVTELKQEIEKLTSVPVDRQRLVYMGKLVKDEDRLDKHVKEDNQTIHLMARSEQQPSQPNQRTQPQQQQQQQQQNGASGMFNQPGQNPFNLGGFENFGGNNLVFRTVSSSSNINNLGQTIQQMLGNVMGSLPQNLGQNFGTSVNLGAQQTQQPPQTQQQQVEQPQQRTTRQIYLPFDRVLNIGLQVNALMGGGTMPGPPLPQLNLPRNSLLLLGSFLLQYQWQISRILPLIYRVGDLMQRESLITNQQERQQVQQFANNIGNAIEEIAKTSFLVSRYYRDLQIGNQPGEFRIVDNGINIQEYQNLANQATVRPGSQQQQNPQNQNNQPQQSQQQPSFPFNFGVNSNNNVQNNQTNTDDDQQWEDIEDDEVLQENQVQIQIQTGIGVSDNLNLLNNPNVQTGVAVIDLTDQGNMISSENIQGIINSVINQLQPGVNAQNLNLNFGNHQHRGNRSRSNRTGNSNSTNNNAQQSQGNQGNQPGFQQQEQQQANSQQGGQPINFLEMNLRDMMQQNQQNWEEGDEEFLELFGSTKVTDMIQLVMTSNYEFLDRMQPQIREGYARLLEKYRDEMVIAKKLSKDLVKTFSPNMERHRGKVIEGFDPKTVAEDIYLKYAVEQFKIIQASYPIQGRPNSKFSSDLVNSLKQCVGEIMYEVSEGLINGLDDLKVIFIDNLQETVQRQAGQQLALLGGPAVYQPAWNWAHDAYVLYKEEEEKKRRAEVEKQKQQDPVKQEQFGDMEVEQNPTEEDKLIESIKSAIENDRAQQEELHIQNLSEEYLKGDINYKEKL